MCGRVSIVTLTMGNNWPVKQSIAACISLVLCMFFGSGVHAQSVIPRYDFRIEETAFGPAIAEIVRQTGQNVLFPYELVDEVGLNPVIGRYTLDEALSVMFRDTQFSGGLSENGVMFITRSDAANAKRREVHVADNKIKKSLLAGVSTFIVGVFSPSVGAAQGDDGIQNDKDDVIVVTAQRREQSILDVPLSLSVFSEDAIESYQIESLSDFANLAPNLGFVDFGTPADVEISIRGVTNFGGAVNSVGVYVDEFNVSPATESDTYDSNLYDIERIEVLRGPQGTSFGRNVLGGAISITTKKPSDEFEGYASAEYGSYDTYKVRGAVNVPLSDKFFVRVNGYYEDSEGFIDNIGTGTESNFLEQYGGRIAARFEPSDALTLDASIAYSVYDSGLYGNSLPDGTFTEFYQSLALNYVDPSVFPFVPNGYETIGFFPQNTDTVNVNGSISQERELLLTTAQARYDFGAVLGVLNAGYIDNSTTREGDFDFSPLDLVSRTGPFTLESYSIEGRLQSNTDAAWSWLVGFLYAEDEEEFEGVGILEKDFTDGFEAFLPFALPDEIVNFDTTDTQKTESLGIFADFDYQATDRLNLSAGIRYSRDEVTESRENRPGFFELAVPPTQIGSGTYDNYSLRLAGVYELTDSVNVYTQIGRGTKPGGFNLGATTNPNIPPTYDTEVLWNYEAGMKGALFDGKLSFNAAAFYMDWSDLQIFTFEIVPGSVNQVELATRSVGSAESYGVEVDFVASLTDELTINGGFGFNETKVGSGILIPDQNPNFAGGPNGVDVSGNDLPRSSPLMANLAVEYNRPLTDSLDVFGRVEATYRDDFFTDLRQGEASPASIVTPTDPEIDGYETVNLRLGVENEAVRFVLFAENVTQDVTPIGVIGTNPNAMGNRIGLLPRYFGARLTYKFGK
mgnify:CR=1 FL=1